MRQANDNPFILVGSRTKGGVCYICEPGPDGHTWIVYDVAPGGDLTNPRVVFGASSAGWRGLPEFA